MVTTWIVKGAPLSWLTWTWSVITMPVTLPLWLLLLGVSICVLLFPIAGRVYAVAFGAGDGENRKPEWKKYRGDLIFGIKWRWRYRKNSIFFMLPLCPHCEHELKVKNAVWHCPNCDFQKNAEQELKTPLSSYETVTTRAAREVERRIRTDEYKQRMQENR